METQKKITICANDNDMVKALRELADLLEATPESLKVITTKTFWAERSEGKQKEKVNWTEEKHAILRNMYNEGIRHSEMAKHFNCSVRAIESQLNRLGLNNSFTTMESSPNYKNMRHGHPYSQQELDFIKDSYTKGSPIEKIAEDTHRSTKAIEIQLTKLNLIKDEDNS